MEYAEEMQISKEVALSNIKKEKKIHVHSNAPKKPNYKQYGILCTLIFFALL